MHSVPYVSQSYAQGFYKRQAARYAEDLKAAREALPIGARVKVTTDSGCWRGIVTGYQANLLGGLLVLIREDEYGHEICGYRHEVRTI